jgi:mono/diheme cytochrome c family protein
MTGCHDEGTQKAGFYASSYESAMQFITPGKAKSSKLYNVLSAVYFGEMMPPDQPLSLEHRTMIELWIEQGALKDCAGANPNPDPGGNINDVHDSVCFAQSILPILQSSCAVSKCHDPISRVEGYDFSSYTSVRNGEEAVVPYFPNESKIYKSIIKTSGEDRMPPFPRDRLTNAQIEALRKWISQGALNSDCPTNVCDTVTAISFSADVLPIIQQNCTGCHGISNPNGNVSLTNYSQIKTYAETIRNGMNMFSGVLNSKPGFASMPPYSQLDKCTIRTIELWIEQGKLKN